MADVVYLSMPATQVKQRPLGPVLSEEHVSSATLPRIDRTPSTPVTSSRFTVLGQDAEQLAHLTTSKARVVAAATAEHATDGNDPGVTALRVVQDAGYGEQGPVEAVYQIAGPESPEANMYARTRPLRVDGPPVSVVLDRDTKITQIPRSLSLSRVA